MLDNWWFRAEDVWKWNNQAVLSSYLVILSFPSAYLGANIRAAQQSRMDILTAHHFFLSSQTDLSWNTKGRRNWICRSLSFFALLAHWRQGGLRQPPSPQHYDINFWSWGGVQKTEGTQSSAIGCGSSFKQANRRPNPTPGDRHTSSFIDWYRSWTTLFFPKHFSNWHHCVCVCVCLWASLLFKYPHHFPSSSACMALIHIGKKLPF